MVSVRHDEDWAGLVEAMGRPDGAGATELSEAAGRMERRDQVNSMVAAWASGLTPLEVEAACQARGVPAGRVLSAFHQMEDPHLLDRGFIVEVDQPGAGSIVLEGPCITGSKMARPVITAAPLLGEHTREICLNELGMSADRLEDLLATGALEELDPQD